MVEAFIIEEQRRLKQQKQARIDEQRPRIQLPYEYPSHPKRDQKNDENKKYT